MKIPKTTKTHCKHCKTHTKHVTTIAKKRERGTLKIGSMARLEKRGMGKAGIGNKGRYSRKAPSGRKRMGAKSSKKIDLRLKCETCKKTSVKSTGKRLKKVAIE